MASDPESRGERETWILSPCTVQTRQAFPLDLPQGALPPPPWDRSSSESNANVVTPGRKGINKGRRHVLWLPWLSFFSLPSLLMVLPS